AGQIIREITDNDSRNTVVYRNQERYVKEIQTLDLEPQKENIVKDGGVYLISGGAKGIGAEISKKLAASTRVKLIIIGRSSIDKNKDWTKTARQIAGLGSAVEYLAVDVSQSEELNYL